MPADNTEHENVPRAYDDLNWTWEKPRAVPNHSCVLTKKRREAPSFTAVMDRCWARGARCPSDQSNPGASRALNGRGEHGGGGPVLQGGEDVHPSRNAGPCHDTCHSILPKALGSSRPDSLLG